jgi:hypothetical protein
LGPCPHSLSRPISEVYSYQNLFPGAATATLSATQRAYQSYANNAPDYSYALYEMDVLCRPSCSKFGPYSFFNRQYSYLRTLRSNGNGNYHGMLWTVRKRFTNGDEVTFNYTFSKSIDLASTPENSTALQGVIINAYDKRLFRAVSDYDARHQWNANFVYGLPFGKNKAFAPNAGGLLNAIIGGWQLSGLYRASTGLPVGIGNGRFWPTNWNVTGNATVVGTFQDGTNKSAPRRHPRREHLPEPRRSRQSLRLLAPRRHRRPQRCPRRRQLQHRPRPRQVV